MATLNDYTKSDTSNVPTTKGRVLSADRDGQAARKLEKLEP